MAEPSADEATRIARDMPWDDQDRAGRGAALTDVLARVSREALQGENFDANVRAAGAVRDLAARKGATPAQIALAWLLHKGEDVVPIPGTKRRTYLEENIAAAELALSHGELAALDQALAPEKVEGPRYAPQMMRQVERREGMCRKASGAPAAAPPRVLRLNDAELVWPRDP